MQPSPNPWAKRSGLTGRLPLTQETLTSIVRPMQTHDLHKVLVNNGRQFDIIFLHTVCRRFETGGSLGRRVNVVACPSPDGSARGRARRGEKGGRRQAWERWKSRDLRVRPAPRSGALAVEGYKRPRGRGSERPHASACLVLVPARPTLCKRALVLPFIGVRRGSRCTMGV
jgi:hypothetical protein